MLKYEIVDSIAEAVEEFWPLHTREPSWNVRRDVSRSGMRPHIQGKTAKANLILPVRGYSNADPDTKSELLVPERGEPTIKNRFIHKPA